MGSTRVEPCNRPFNYESRGGLTDSGLLLFDFLVFTRESEEDEILGGDPKPDSGSERIKTSTIG